MTVVVFVYEIKDQTFWLIMQITTGCAPFLCFIKKTVTKMPPNADWVLSGFFRAKIPTIGISESAGT